MQYPSLLSDVGQSYEEILGTNVTGTQVQQKRAELYSNFFRKRNKGWLHVLDLAHENRRKDLSERRLYEQ